MTTEADPKRDDNGYPLNTWTPIRSGRGRQRVLVYWHYPVSRRRRGSIVRDGKRFRWSIYEREDPRFGGWTKVVEKFAPTLPQAKKAVVAGLAERPPQD